MPEGRIGRHQEGPHPFAGTEQAEERLGLEAGERLVERLHDELVDPQRVHTLDELLGIAQARRWSALQHGVGMRIERDGRRGHVRGSCLADESLQDRPVTPMEAVEHADRDDALARPVELV